MGRATKEAKEKIVLPQRPGREFVVPSQPVEGNDRLNEVLMDCSKFDPYGLLSARSPPSLGAAGTDHPEPKQTKSEP
jgi:hypothetical protein